MIDFTPQQEEFLKNYLDPKCPNFGNALQSALKAGYAQNTAENITVNMPKWLEISVVIHFIRSSGATLSGVEILQSP